MQWQSIGGDLHIASAALEGADDECACLRTHLHVHVYVHPINTAAGVSALPVAAVNTYLPLACLVTPRKLLVVLVGPLDWRRSSATNSSPRTCNTVRRVHQHKDAGFDAAAVPHMT